jgi:hypothetical protein
MKRSALPAHLRAHGCELLREGARHNEIIDNLARKICKDLGIPFVR